jgi:curli biogenesis system outer membrane secretion channel CsgG
MTIGSQTIRASLLNLIFLLLATLSSIAHAAPKIGVVDFDTTQYPSYRLPLFGAVSDERSNQINVVGQQFAEYITDELVNSGLFDVVERQKLEGVMNELGINNSAWFDQGSAPRVGKLLGATYLLTGKVTNIGAAEERFADFGMQMNVVTISVTASIRIINTETGTIAFSARANGKKKLKASSDGRGYQSQSDTNLGDDLAQSLAVDLIARLRASGKQF